jgi:hypothetical protein
MMKPSGMDSTGATIDFLSPALRDAVAAKRFFQKYLRARGAIMISPAAEQTLILSAACFHIGDGDERLRTRLSSLSTPN